MDVDNFIRDCAAYVGESVEISFYWRAREASLEKEVTSPIEQVFYAAVCTLLETNYVAGGRVKGQASLAGMRDIWIESGIEIWPQTEIGPYRVDFVLSYKGEATLVDAVHSRTVPVKPLKEIVVELDGHAFHDRDARQRSYEKKRDRFLQKQGYEVFHYTGSDVVKDPFGVAAECLAELTGASFTCPETGER